MTFTAERITEISNMLIELEQIDAFLLDMEEFGTLTVISGDITTDEDGEVVMPPWPVECDEVDPALIAKQAIAMAYRVRATEIRRQLADAGITEIPTGDEE
jgi:hypothetical protein